MAEYRLSPDESIILRNTNIKSGGMMSSNNDELLLTTKNIVHIKRGAFGGSKAINAIPVKAVKVHEDRAQVFYGKNPQTNAVQLQIYLINGEELKFDFLIDGRRSVTKWVNELNKLATGDSNNIIYDETQEKGAKGFVTGFIKEAMGMAGEPELARRLSPNAARSTQHCIGCGAPISGVVGQTVRCEYCDMEQTIK